MMTLCKCGRHMHAYAEDKRSSGSLFSSYKVTHDINFQRGKPPFKKERHNLGKVYSNQQRMYYLILSRSTTQLVANCGAKYLLNIFRFHRKTNIPFDKYSATTIFEIAFVCVHFDFINCESPQLQVTFD
jgi:hypothetical protein